MLASDEDSPTKKSLTASIVVLGMPKLLAAGIESQALQAVNLMTRQECMLRSAFCGTWSLLIADGYTNRVW